MNIKELWNKTKEDYKNLNKKNILIIVIVLIILAAIVTCGYAFYQKQHDLGKFPQEEEAVPEESVMFKTQNNPEMKPSEYKIGISYEKAMKGDKPVLVLFFADWCGYCMRFMPMYQTLSNIYKKEFNFSKINVEDPKYQKLVEDTGITGFPTLYIFDPKYDNKVLLPNVYFGDFRKLRGEIERYIRIRGILDSKS